jgi:hypothetical protein
VEGAGEFIAGRLRLALRSGDGTPCPHEGQE